MTLHNQNSTNYILRSDAQHLLYKGKKQTPTENEPGNRIWQVLQRMRQRVAQGEQSHGTEHSSGSNPSSTVTSAALTLNFVICEKRITLPISWGCWEIKETYQYLSQREYTTLLTFFSHS